MKKYRLYFISIISLIILSLLLQFCFNIERSSNKDDINKLLLLKNKIIKLKSCNIVKVHGPDKYAATATLIWLYPINFFLYAERNNMILWIDFNNDYNKNCYDPKMNDENVWNYYLNPIEPLSQGCNISISNISILSKKFIFPELHYNVNYTIHAWYYHWYHNNKKNIDYNKYYDNFYYKNRIIGYKIVKKYFKYKKNIINNVNKLWIKYFGNNSLFKYKILGVHMRGTDKGGHRRKVNANEYMDYMNKFMKYYGYNKTRFFIATDDINYLLFIKNNFNGIWYAQNNIIRSSTKTAIFNLKNISKYEIGKEVIIDILLLSKCDWFIHSASAVSESVFYNNINLHNKSVHLEYIKSRQNPIWYSHWS